MSVVLEGVVQASLIVSIGVAIFSGLFHKMYNRWKPAGMLWAWRILGIRLCILYPLVYKIFAVDLQQGSPSFAGTSDFALNMAVHSYFSVALPRQGAYVLFWIWITGAVLFLGIHFIRFQIAMKKLLNSSEKISNLYEFSLQYGLPAKSRWKRVEVRCCGAMNGPMLIGFYKKYLLISEKILDRQDMQLLLRHELTHYVKKDIWLKQYFLICNSLHWFNPIIYWMRARVTEMIELACDYEVVKNLDTAERKCYAELLYYTLQNTQKGVAISSVSLAAKFKTMKFRFANIVNTQKRKSGFWVYAGIFIALYLLQSVIYVDIQAEPFQPSYIEFQCNENRTAHIEKMNFADFYCFNKKYNFEQIDENQKLILEPGESAFLYLSPEGETLKLKAGDIMHIQLHIEKNADIWLKLGGIESKLEDMDKGEKIVLQRDIEGPIQLINYSSENAIIY